MMSRVSLLLFAASVCLPAQDPVVLTIGAEKITRSEWERFIDSLPERVRAEARGENKRRMAEQFAEIKTLAQAARDRKLDQVPLVKAQIALQTDNILANHLYQEIQKTSTPDQASARAYFDAHKSEYEEVSARHILVRFQGSRVPVREGHKDLTDAEALAAAQAIRKRILGGEDFAAVAKADSDDTGSGSQGGSLGSFPRGNMVPDFEEVAFKQAVGILSDPVRTQFGYHLIEVQARTTRSFEDVREEIEKKLRPQLAQKTIDEIKKKGGVILDEAYFGK